MVAAWPIRSARSALALVLASALAALPTTPAAALDVEDAGDDGEIRVLCVRGVEAETTQSGDLAGVACQFVCVAWDADTETPKAYDPIDGHACTVAGTADAATDPPENKPFALLHHAIRQLQADIDVRLTTEPPAPLRWQITVAGPNHLYYAALSLLRNTSGSRAGRSANGTCLASDAPEKNAATLDVVTNAVVCVNNQLRQRLGIAAAARAASSAPQQATGESALQVAARMLERLMATGRALPVETTPSDIYDRLEDALGNLAGLAKESLPPLPPPSKQAKNAADVYTLVFRCLRLSQVLEVKRNMERRQRGTLALSQWHGVEVAPNAPSLQINIAKDAGSAGVDLAHVYDLATLLAAQLGAIGDGGNREAVRAHARPSEATLSDVFGLAIALEAQLMKMTGVTGRR